MIIAFQTTQWTLQCYRWVQEVNSRIIETCIVRVWGGGGGGCACACTKINTLASDICSTFPALIVGGSDFSKQYEVFQFINTTTTHPNLWNVGDLPTRSRFITTTKDMLSPLDFHGYRFLHSWKKPQCRTTLAPVNDINIGLIELTKCQ